MFLLLWYTPPRPGVPAPFGAALRRREELRTAEDEEALLLAWWALITEGKA